MAQCCVADGGARVAAAIIRNRIELRVRVRVPGGFGTRPWCWFVCLWRRLFLSPLHILTLCGSERVLVVSTEPPDGLSCLTTPGVGCPRDGLLPVPLTGCIQMHTGGGGACVRACVRARDAQHHSQHSPTARPGNQHKPFAEMPTPHWPLPHHKGSAVTSLRSLLLYPEKVRNYAPRTCKYAGTLRPHQTYTERPRCAVSPPPPRGIPLQASPCCHLPST